jgi:hypothetical protein
VSGCSFVLLSSQSCVNWWNIPLPCTQYIHAHPQHPTVLFSMFWSQMSTCCHKSPRWEWLCEKPTTVCGQ